MQMRTNTAAWAGCCGLFLCTALANAAGLDPTALPGLVADDEKATLSGVWSQSTHTKPYVGAGYSYSPGGPDCRATFALEVPASGEYRLLVAHTAGANRSAAVKIVLKTSDQTKDFTVNQQKPATGLYNFNDLGLVQLEAGEVEVIIHAEENRQGVVIADAVALMTAEQFAAAQAEAAKNSPKLLAALAPEPKNAKNPKKPAQPAPAGDAKKPAPVAAEVAPAFVRQPPAKPLRKLSPSEIDALLQKFAGLKPEPLADDAAFLRRVSFDLIGRQPTLAEAEAFAADTMADKRARAIERLLASPEFGANWADYWSDVISYRTPQPELTFLNYTLFKQWLAEKFNRNAGWDEAAYSIITATGKVADNPAATFVGFHQADRSRLAGETTRVFLSTQIACAECHDHKFIDMPQETFHHVAAFFVRSSAKLPWNDSSEIIVSSKPAGEHKMPGANQEMQPIAFSARKVELGKSDVERRTELAHWVVGPDNPWFGKAFTNRIWARLMGRGFCEPVDEIGELGDRVLPELHAAVAEHFVATGCDAKDLFRLICNSQAYQRQVRDGEPGGEPFATIPAGRLRGDEVFLSLQAGIALPNVTPPAMKPTAEIRFPPPPKSTRDLVNEAFGFDPSLDQGAVVRTMQQAMFLMNNEQVQKQIDATPGSGTVLAKLAEAFPKDEEFIPALYQTVLARKPNEREAALAKAHLAKIGERQAALEDLLWSMLNSAEFLSRR